MSTAFKIEDYSIVRNNVGFNVITYPTLEKKILLGFEFEVETPGDSTSRESQEVLRTFQEQHPQSIARYEWFGSDSHGPEYKSFVAPLEIHKKFLSNKLDHFTNRRRQEENSHGGIHVSINYNEFTDKTRGKVFEFLHNKKYKPLFLTLSGRSRSHFDHYSPQNHPNGLRYHYNIINEEKIRSGSTTTIGRYEFRMFHAQKRLLFPALEMIESLFQLSHLTSANEDITQESWFEFISTKLKYSNIYAHVKKCGYKLPRKTSARKVRTI